MLLLIILRLNAHLWYPFFQPPTPLPLLPTTETAVDPAEGVSFRFKNKFYVMTAKMQVGQGVMTQRGGLTNADLDTLSNWYSARKQYVEIVRQDNAVKPRKGIALGFEFDEYNGEYPYTPAHAVLQVKNFAWGGIEFSGVDTLNYTGISNNISDDFSIEINGFQNDTIYGHFSGLLLSGGGAMAPVEEGYFRVRVYRK